MTNSQKKSISKYTKYIYELRTVTTNLTNVLEAYTSKTNITNLNNKLDILMECYAHSSILLDQFTIVLKCIPEISMNSNSEAEFDIVLSDSLIAKCYKDNDEWRELYKKVKAIITHVDKQKAALTKLIKSNPKQIGEEYVIPNISQAHIDIVEDAKINLHAIIEKAEAILQEYSFKLKTKIVDGFVPQHPLLRCIEKLVKYVKETIGHLDQLDTPIDQEMNETYSNTLTSEAEDIIATMLLTIQSLYKNHLSAEKSIDNLDVLDAIDEIIDEGEKEKEESKEILEDKHLKELLQERIVADSKLLQLDTLINKMRSLLCNYVDFIACRPGVEEVRIAIMRVVPILEQVLLFVQYFVSQKVAVHRVSCKMLSVLLKIFSDLAIKG